MPRVDILIIFIDIKNFLSVCVYNLKTRFIYGT